MCRFLGYLGKTPILMSDLLNRPKNSLVNQSWAAKEGPHSVNADGFGIAWYAPEIAPEPGIFKSTRPAWNDSNLQHLSHKIKSPCFLGHVRSSTVGGVSLENCHPFSYKQYALVHNGTIRHFEKLRRPLLNLLSDSLFASVKAQTDSEHFFFLVMQFLSESTDASLENALLKAVDWVQWMQKDEAQEVFSRLNLLLTDGKQMIATRFASKGQEPLSLYYSLGASSHILAPQQPQPEAHDALVIASEPLCDLGSTWVAVPPNHYLVVESATISPQINAF